MKPKYGRLGRVTIASQVYGYDVLAKSITAKLNTFAYRQSDPELARLYNLYRQSVDNWRSLTVKYLRDCPPPKQIPTLTGKDVYTGMTYLAAYCTDAARSLGSQSATPVPSWEARALTYLVENPTMSVTEIARKVGVHRQRLYESETFVKARGIQQEAERQSRLDVKTRGTKSKTGDILDRTL